jgi:hypothetical protein
MSQQVLSLISMLELFVMCFTYLQLLASVNHPNVISYKEAFIDESSGSLW